MFNNLEAEIKRKGIKKDELAKAIGRTYGTLTLKLAGKYPFTYDEAKTIYEQFFPECNFIELFSRAGDKDEKAG